MNLPNRLTMSRIIMVPFFVMALSADRVFSEEWLVAGRWTALALFICASITDYLDGAIARARGLITPFGQLFDPLADKLLTMSAFVCMVEVAGPRGGPMIPGWAVVLILGREFLVTGMRGLAASQGIVIQADRMGKHKTAWQMGGLIAMLLIGAVLATIPPEAPATPLVRSVGEAIRIMALLSIVGMTTLSGVVFYRKNRHLFDQPRTCGREETTGDGALGR